MSHSLRSVLQAHPINVPLLQRDFAQGRATAGEIRERFLDALFEHLTQDPAGRSALDLDFVYGSATDGGVFTPLDGQQRLTTLFLLHWYLANRDRAMDHFRTYAASTDGARFSYRVRPSAKDFFDQLVQVNLDPDTLAEGPRALSTAMQGSVWFFRTWLHDPTVASCLVVLDEIHARFAGESGLYAQLAHSERPAITFQFLNLQTFGLTDDLYIKMNARGKPLTAFETFKASFGALAKAAFPGVSRSLPGTASPIPFDQFLARRFDTEWSDLFWVMQTTEREADEIAMNLVRAIAMVAFAQGLNSEDRPDVARLPLDALRGAKKQVPPQTFHDYSKLGLLTPEFVEAVADLLDRWTAGNGRPATYLADVRYYDESAMLKHLARGLTDGPQRVVADDWIRFVGWCLYLRSERPIDGLADWMRLVSNLARNTIYNRADDLRVSLLAMCRMLREAEDLVEYVAALPDRFPGFNRQQLREERIKAQLLLKHPQWRVLIEAAETHPYFRGQIEFLLDFIGVLDEWGASRDCGWDEAADVDFRENMEQWTAKAVAVFSLEDGDGGIPAALELLWQQALLCMGDYLPKAGSNYSFLENSGRDLSWKRLLRADLRDGHARDRRAFAGWVLENVDPDDVVGSLQAIVETGVLDDESEFPGWRQRLVDEPALIRYCRKRLIRWDYGQAVFLIRGQTLGGKYKELFTAHLARTLGPRIRAGEFAPYNRFRCDDDWGLDVVHGLRLTSNSGVGSVYVVYRANGYDVSCPTAIAPPGTGGQQDGRCVLRVGVNELEGTLQRLADRASLLTR